MLTKKQNLTREILTVILLLAAVAATEYWFFQLWRLDWHVPMFYGGDGIYWVGQVQRSYGELSGSLGWPFYEVAGRYDPNYDLIYDIFVWFVGLFTKDTGTVFNLYVLVIPFANALAGYAVFRMVGLRRWLSFAFGLTFGLTPYVQQRMAGHMMLAACEFVPFSVLLCLWCAEDEQFNRPGRGFFKNKRNWLALAMAWGIANNGAAYYPYFTCFFLCVTALCLILRDRRWRAGTSCVVTIAEIVAWMIPDFFPMVLGILNGQGSTLTNGVYRSPVGADIYSLRISSLLLSPNGFGLQKLANWMGRYFHVLATDEGPMYNENAYGYLGIVGIFGFLALLLMLLHSRDWKAGRTERPELGDRLWLLSRLNVMALLLATIAGFGGIIGIFVRFIRGYNRISPYIAFFALLAVGLALEKQLTRRTGRSRKALAAVAILLLGCSLAFLLHRMIAHPISALQSRIEKISSGDFSADPDIEWDNELGDIGRGINSMSAGVTALMEHRLEDEKQKQDLEYRMLQNQINPHFIYNTLNSIKWMATIQHAPGIAEMVMALSRLLKSISKSNERLVPLYEEFALLNDYFTIQQYRYGGTITLDVSYIEDESLNHSCLIPRFTLQPLVENAIFHGIEPKGSAGEVTLRVERDTANGDVLIHLTDDGVGMTPEQAAKALQEPGPEEAAAKYRHVGMWNVHKRLQYSFGEAYGLSIESEPDIGTTVTIRLPGPDSQK